MVVIAAYLAVHQHGQGMPTTRAELLDELLAHEERYWQATSQANGLVCDAVLRRRVVALATLAGADSEDEASELLRLVPDLGDEPSRQRRRLARWVNELYPAGPRWWNPLEPDLLGEQLVATTYIDHPEVLAGVLDRDAPHAIVQPLDLYARAAADRAELAGKLVPILSEHLSFLCEFAATQASSEKDLDLLLGDTTIAAALDRTIKVVPPDPDVVAPVVDALPQRSDLVLSPLALTLTGYLLDHVRRLAVTNAGYYEHPLAMALNNLSVRLTHAGRREEGLTAIEEAVAVHRRLTAANPATHEPGLAMALNNLSVHLAESGRRDDALAAVEEAVTVRRRLAQVNPADHEANLAAALNNLSILLAEAGRRDDGMATIKEAVAVYRRLVAANPAAYEPDLAMALNNLSNRLADMGLIEEGLAAIQQAVAVYRRLAAANPAAYEPDLALALINLSERFADAERSDDAQRARDEATGLARRHAPDE